MVQMMPPVSSFTFVVVFISYLGFCLHAPPNSLKSKLRQKHLHSLTSTTTNLDDGLRSIINQRTDVMPQSVIILTHQKKPINLPVIVKEIIIEPNQNQVSLLTEMAQILNQIQGFEVLVGQPISLRKFGSSTFLVNDPRITELKV